MKTRIEFKDPSATNVNGETAKSPDEVKTALVIDDNDADAEITTRALERCAAHEFSVERVKALKDAQIALKRSRYSVVLLEADLGDSCGLKTVSEILRVNPNIPLIVVSRCADASIAIDALRLGAQDFLPKAQFDDLLLQRMVAYAIERKQKEIDLASKAFIDPLTGLANRTLLTDRWDRGLARSKRAGRKTGVIIADIDRFKLINDRLGHDAGDKVLIDFGHLLSKSLRKTDIVARLGGDEFVAVLENVRSKVEVDFVVDSLYALQPFRFRYGGDTIDYSVSIGSTVSDPEAGEDFVEAAKRADADMYKQKAISHGPIPSGAILLSKSQNA